MEELVTMRRGKADENDIAVVRKEWVEEWKGYGYKVVKASEATDAVDQTEQPQG